MSEKNSPVGSGGHPLDWLDLREKERIAAGLRRRVRPRPADEPDVLDLAGNDYLGLARHPRVLDAAADAVREWGAGSTGSRLVTGSTRLHADLEDLLAAHLECEAALVFSSGYLANIAAITSLVGRGDLVVSDAINHASIVDACRLSRARVTVTPHCDVAAVEAALANRSEERALVVVDAVFSVDGDLAPLAALSAVVRRHNAVLLVDEAHGLGVMGAGGRGAVHEAGLAGADHVVQTVTLSKAMGSQGGAVVGPARVRDHLIDTARPFIFDTGLAPVSVAAALESLRILREQPELAEAVRHKARRIAYGARDLGLDTTLPAGAVASVLIGAPEKAFEAARRSAEMGVRVGCFRPPSVPDGLSRLRIAARADLTDADITRALDTLGSATRGL
ncbi:8-amino-7-oxononanoate synthase [Yinghuangia sp. ASG 101]|uniref:8-amino-7-oxononanoate synthase n=1 Tax=Yinghuangia sp. ASG 101 TaxID=2896848 RepID=UPI001E511624|nr:8-amino-7-oxononanoate synthase [Yinghuangia sp. ASG 101]UGQ14353.1 8-amino-7-oxononanoate synthase [Yinghuangia sp. ASG 101]